MSSESTQDTYDELPKKARKKLRTQSSGGGLNINSMMDIMTILLVFLLVSITSDPLNVTQNTHLQLASSTADIEPQSAITIQINRKAITVDSTELVQVDCSLDGGQLCRADEYADPKLTRRYRVSKHAKKDGDEKQFLIQRLFEGLEVAVAEAKEEWATKQAKNPELGAWPGAVNVVCDREIPYRMVAEVVHTAAMAGLHRLRFANIKTKGR